MTYVFHERVKFSGKTLMQKSAPEDALGSWKSNEYHWTWPNLDITFYGVNETHVYELAKTYGRLFAYKREHVLPLVYRPFCGRWVPSPIRPLALLDHAYPGNLLCHSGTYSHVLGTGLKVTTVRCGKLASRYPFVRRKAQYTSQEAFVLLDEELSIFHDRDTSTRQYWETIHTIPVLYAREEAATDPVGWQLRID